MRRIAAPMVGGVFSSFVAILVVFPALYFLWRSIGLEKTPLFPDESTTDESTTESSPTH
jgi:Cu(I)/Ag(I) efflux system membrane protein CusA/SilA